MSRVRLVACPACVRHVRVDERECPFCKAMLPSSVREASAPPLPSVRLSRAALYALRAGALSVTTAACGGSVVIASGNEDGGSNDSASADDVFGGGSSSGANAISGGGSSSGANVAVPYGLPPLPDSGSIGVGATDGGVTVGPQDASPRDAEGRDVIYLPPPPPYGGPPPGM